MRDETGSGAAPDRSARVLAVVDDLFVRARIDAAAEAAGVEVRYVASADEARRLVDGRTVRALLVGMSATRRPWAEIVRDVKADSATRPIFVLAFGPHKNLDLR